MMKNDKRNGYGRLIQTNSYYLGDWENDLMHGHGIQYDFTSGKIIEGLWEKNRYIGDIRN
jgi:hypothetical protein